MRFLVSVWIFKFFTDGSVDSNTKRTGIGRNICPIHKRSSWSVAALGSIFPDMFVGSFRPRFNQMTLINVFS